MSIRLASQPRYPVRILSGAPATGGDCSDWGRPDEWPAMPTIGENEQAFVGLVGIHDTSNEPVAIRFLGAYTVDWGDGSATENFASNAIAQHNYVFGTMPQAVTSLGYKCAIIKVTPQAGQNLSFISTQQTPTGVSSQTYASPFLELLINAASCSQMTLGGGIHHKRIRRAEIRKHAMTSVDSLFRGMKSLVSIPVFNTASVTNFSGMCYECQSLQNAPAISFAAATNVTNIFYLCEALGGFFGTYTPSMTVAQNNFNGCISLKHIGPVDFSGVTTSTNMFYYCSELSRCQGIGMKVTHSYSGCSLPATALNEIFTNLASGVTGQTITITGNPGAGTCDQSIATTKGWTVAN